MLRAFVIGAAAAATLCATAASAQVVNLASVDQSTGGAPTPTSLILGPGVYSATLIGVSAGGLYNAWNAATTNGQFYPTGTPSPAPGFYTEEYTISVGGGAATDVYGGAGSKYATAAAALAAYTSSPHLFTVTNPGTVVSFQIPDVPGFYGDNTGGVSLRIAAAAPEPATWAMMIVGFGVVGFAMRRRQKTTARVSYAV